MDTLSGLRQDIAQLQLKSYLQGSGSKYVDHLQAAFKNRAKTLHRALRQVPRSPSLRATQEALSRAMGFPRLHALQELLGSLRDELDGAELAQRIALLDGKGRTLLALTPLQLLQQDFRGATAVAEDDLEALARFTGVLARHLLLDLATVRDAIAQGWANEPQWSRLGERTPLNSTLTEPLVTFQVEDHAETGRQVGRFHISEAGHWLWDNVLGGELECSFDDDEDAWSAFRNARVLAERHPELLVAWSYCSSLLEWHGDVLGGGFPEMLRLLDEGLKHSQRLIPKGFKGTLPWGFQDNRPYLRILYQKMSLCARSRFGLPKALAVARKLLQLNPNDNQSVRCKLPLLLAVCGAADSTTDKAIERAVATGGPSGQVNAGLALLFRGQPEGLAHVLEGVLLVPVFGVLLLDDETLRPAKAVRHGPIGYEDPFDEMVVALRVFNDRFPTAQWLREVLSDAELLEEEGRLAELVSTRDGERDRWLKEVPDVARVQAKRLLQRYPLP